MFEDESKGFRCVDRRNMGSLKPLNRSSQDRSARASSIHGVSQTDRQRASQPARKEGAVRSWLIDWYDWYCTVLYCVNRFGKEGGEGKEASTTIPHDRSRTNCDLLNSRAIDTSYHRLHSKAVPPSAAPTLPPISGQQDRQMGHSTPPTHEPPHGLSPALPRSALPSTPLSY